MSPALIYISGRERHKDSSSKPFDLKTGVIICLHIK